MGYADVLRGLTALFLEGPETADRGALLAARAPGLSDPERRTLAALADDRVAIYSGLVRENQATMLGFVAPGTLAAAAELGGVTRLELARATLVDTPRRTARLRELARRLVDHLRGAGATITARCPALLDLAVLECARTEGFYAPDDADALSPAAFAERVGTATVDEVLRFRARPSSSLRIVRLACDVVDWHARAHERGTWAPAPIPEPTPVGIAVARDPATLQPAAHRVPESLLSLLESTGPDEPAVPLEALAERWIGVTETAPDDPDAAARFFEQTAAWVRAGILAVSLPAGGASPDGTGGP